MLGKDELGEELHYDPLTGKFTMAAARKYHGEFANNGLSWSVPEVVEITYLPIGQQILTEAASNG